MCSNKEDDGFMGLNHMLRLGFYTSFLKGNFKISIQQINIIFLCMKLFHSQRVLFYSAILEI